MIVYACAMCASHHGLSAYLQCQAAGIVVKIARLDAYPGRSGLLGVASPVVTPEMAAEGTGGIPGLRAELTSCFLSAGLCKHVRWYLLMCSTGIGMVRFA